MRWWALAVVCAGCGAFQACVQPRLVRQLRASGEGFALSYQAQLSATRKVELAQLCRDAGLKVSGSKAELVERLLGLQAANAAVAAQVQVDDRREAAAAARNAPVASAPSSGGVEAPASMQKAFARDPELHEATIDLLITELRDGDLDAVDPLVVSSKSDALCAGGGAIFEGVARRRLTRAPGDAGLAAAISLLRGFLGAEQKLRARDVVREVLRAATLGGDELDDCFRELSISRRIDEPLRAYVDSLIQEQAHKPSAAASLLPRVLSIIKDRIVAEEHVAQHVELRTLALALRIRDRDERRAFLATELMTSLDFAQRFDAYTRDAADYANNASAGSVDERTRLASILDIRAIVEEVRATMPV